MDVLLLGASGLAREVIASRLRDLTVVGLLDDDPALRGARVGGVDVLGAIATAAERTESLLVCIGSGHARRAVVDRLRAAGVADDRYATALAESLHLPGSVSIGVGSILLAGVVVTADAVIGAHAVAMPNTTITHDGRLGDYVTLASGVSLGGSVHIGDAAYIGMNAAVREGVVIGAGAIVGMGAAVLTDVPAGETWVGVPARRREARP